MKRSVAIIILLTCSWITAHASNGGGDDVEREGKLYQQGKRALLDQDYSTAANRFSTLVGIDQSNIEYQFLAGMSYYKGPKDREKAVSYLENTVASFQTDTIAEAYYYLGLAYCYQSDYDKGIEALQTFKSFLKENKSGSERLQEVEHLIACAKFGKSAEAASDQNIEIMNMGFAVNTEYPEYAGVLTPDKKYMIFTSRRTNTTGGKVAFDQYFYEDIYMTTKDGGDWVLVTDPSKSSSYLYPDFNTPGQDAGVVYTQNGQKLYVYRKDKVYQSLYENGAWTQPEKVGTIDKGSKHLPSVAVSQDGKTMYFASKSTNGMGGLDLFKSTMQDDGNWTAPESMGATINTPGDEDAPHLSADGKTLYFASNGHVGMGGLDLFKVELQDDGTWSKPINLGAPLNSPADDVYYVEDQEAGMAFISSNRMGTTGGMDLFEVALNPPAVPIELIGLAYDPVEQAPLDVVVRLINPETKEVVASANADPKTGAYELMVPSDANYILEVAPAGAEVYTQNFDVPKQTRSYKSFQLLSLGDENNAEGVTVAQELKVQTGFVDVAKKTENADLDVDGVMTRMPFLKNGSTSAQSSATYAAYFDADFEDNGEEFREWTDRREIELLVNVASLGDKARFDQNFSYNEKDINPKGAAFQEWIENVTKLTKSGTTITLYVESSASRVPTRTWKSNKRLSKLRAEDAKNLIIAELQKAGADLTKINWEEKHLVQGPKYKGDFKENRAEYEKYQYVILQIRE